MNTVHRGILTLVRSALTGEKLALPEGFTLEEADELIRKQSLLPMAYQGAYNCGIPANSEIMIRYQMEYYKKLIHSEEQMQSVENIFATFDENGIDYLPLKGSVIKGLYPKPEFRPMGDADILIQNEQYEKVRQAMLALEYQEKLESDHDYTWRSKTLLVEIHKCLFSDQQPEFRDYFGDGWGKAHAVRVNMHGLGHEDEYLYLFAHMTKHFMHSGIGARHMIDLYVYRKAYPMMDNGKIEAVLKRMHMLEFHQNIQRMLSVWFEGQPTDSVTDVITDFVFASGNFGTTENKLYAEEALKAEENGQKHRSKEKALIRILFPPLWYLQLSYNVLYKAPFLFPLFWVVRWFDVLLHRRKRIAKKLGIIHGMTDDKVAEYDKMMRYMGIDLRNQVQ